MQMKRKKIQVNKEKRCRDMMNKVIFEKNYSNDKDGNKIKTSP